MGTHQTPTLEEFLTGPCKQHPRSSYVHFPGFWPIYMRWGPRYIGLQKLGPASYSAQFCPEVVTIASVAARRPGRGEFKKLLDAIKKLQPNAVIFIECIHNTRFYDALQSRYGFHREGFEHMVWFPTKKEVAHESR